MNDLYNTCQYCHYYNNGTCDKQESAESETNLISIFEDGLLEEAIEEGFEHYDFSTIKSMTKKKQNEFQEELENAKINWRNSISYIVERLLKNNLNVLIKTKAVPDFSCKDFK